MAMKRGFLNKTKAPLTDAPTQTKPADPVSGSPAPVSSPTANTKFPTTIQGITFTNYSRRATYPEETCVLTSIAPKTPHASPLRNERTECIFRGGTALKAVFSIPNFPKPMPTPDENTYQILPTPNAGLGMFASRDIKMGDLIVAERPLIVIPMSPHPTIRGGNRDFDWDKFIQPCFDRLSTENQEAYRALANAHPKDRIGPLYGVVLTNNFSLEVGEGEPPINSYIAVFKEISRVNHSCRPNAFKAFALTTFSAQLRALIDIKKGDEIFISYTNLPQTTPERQASLIPYGFQCTCASCTSPSHDRLYQALHDRAMHLSDSFNTWVGNRSLPRDHLIKPALALVTLLETNGFHCTPVYGVNFATLMQCYVALGDLPNAMKYSTICGLWTFAQIESSEFLKRMKNPQTHLRDPKWGARA